LFIFLFQHNKIFKNNYSKNLIKNSHFSVSFAIEMNENKATIPIYVNVILPLAIEKPYTYLVPTELVSAVAFGKRVEVQFGASKLYAGLIVEVHCNAPEGKAKSIFSVIDMAK
jgi:3'DNA-binding domain (3'BD)